MWWAILQRTKTIVVFTIVLTILLASSYLTNALPPISTNLNSGPLVNSIIYKVIPNQDQRVLALQAGEIEMDTSFFDPVHYNTLDADPTIAIYSAPRNGYGHITINCRDYPLNISGLRRAFAYAFDKTRVTSEIMNGFSIEHDSLVPQPNSWCIENDLDWHYYTDQSDIGNQLLDDLGFEINTTTGFRHAPNGDPFDIVILYPSASQEIAGETAQIGVDALHALHIDAKKGAADTNTLDDHGDYDMIFYAVNYYSNDVDWLAYEYWSEYADVPFKNPTNFKNATYDACRQQLLYGTTYEEVYNASYWMQKILQEQVPRLVVYENIYLQAYRTDRFTGYVPDLGSYITGPWTMRKLHRLDSTNGGVVQVAISEEPDSFNIFVTNSPYSEIILTELWPSLYRYGPDLNPYPDIAANLLIEKHLDNPDVQSGHTRFTIDIVHNATWSDGIPLTAEDAAFTFIYNYESSALGNSAGKYLDDLAAAYAPNPYRVILEYNTETYWHFSDFAYLRIIPKHIFNNETGIGYTGWNTWNPVFNPVAPHVTCGPFRFANNYLNESFTLNSNPLFHYAINTSSHELLPPTDTTAVTTTTGTNGWFDMTLVMTSTLSASAMTIILCSVYGIYKHKKLTTRPAE
jgi:ABC-type transport system substrate-binding protein